MPTVYWFSLKRVVKYLYSPGLLNSVPKVLMYALLYITHNTF